MADELEVKEREKTKPVDLNDLQLADEQVDMNADADAFAGPPPPLDGDYRAKLSIGKRGAIQGKDKNKALFYMVHTQAKIIAGDFENRVVFDNPSTMVMQSSGTSRIGGIMKALGEPVGGRVGILDLTRRYAEKLTGEPEVTITTQWSAYCGDCKTDYDNSGGKRGKKGGIVLRAMKRFPENGNGTHRHQLECPICGSMVTANAEIVAYKPVPVG
jgi:hypothetical protein